MAQPQARAQGALRDARLQALGQARARALRRTSSPHAIRTAQRSPPARRVQKHGLRPHPAGKWPPPHTFPGVTLACSREYESVRGTLSCSVRDDAQLAPRRATAPLLLVRRSTPSRICMHTAPRCTSCSAPKMSSSAYFTPPCTYSLPRADWGTRAVAMT